MKFVCWDCDAVVKPAWKCRTSSESVLLADTSAWPRSLATVDRLSTPSLLSSVLLRVRRIIPAESVLLHLSVSSPRCSMPATKEIVACRQLEICYWRLL